MSQLFIQVATPTAGAEVPRSVEVTGSITVELSPRRGPVTGRSVSVRFGDGGPLVAATFPTPTTWRCVGSPNASVPPGGAINLTVTASAMIRFIIVRGEPDIEDVSASVTVPVRVANPPTQVSIDAFAPAISSAQLPMAFTLAGSTTDPDANVTQVQVALDTEAFQPADNVSGNWSRWQKAFTLTAGLHRFVVQATDAGGNVTQQTSFLTVHQSPEPADPDLGSITSWTRLEPQCRTADLGRSVGARLFDPLWLMARQWQMGEFQGEDAGTPVQARVRSTSAILSRCHLGELPANTNAQAPRYNPSTMPLEVKVQRRAMRSTGLSDTRMLSLTVEAGLHFLHMLEQEPLTKSYRDVFIARFALQPLPPDPAAAIDEATRRFAQTMVGRAPDARRLAAAFAGDGAVQVARDPAMQIAPGDQAEVQLTAQAWLRWYAALFHEPEGTDDAWNPSRLEYAVSVSASFSPQPLDQVNLTAAECSDGRLDWHSFDCDLEVNMVSNADRTFAAAVETTVPAPVTFRGAPAVRFWEIEDSRLAFGLLPVGPTDIAQLMMIEYTGSYGNDWFVVPLTLPAGSINRVESLVVTDSFGVRTLQQPIGAQASSNPGFALWQHAMIRRPGSEFNSIVIPNMYFLPPTLSQPLEGAAVEDVVFLRDEMANVAWAVERSIETPIERARSYALPPADDGAPASVNVPRYLLASTVPENWIPLLPTQIKDASGRVISRLKRGAVLQPDGTQKVHQARSRALAVGGELLLHDEDVPREGVRVTLTRRAARGVDGSTLVWTGFSKHVGRGEGSSGLRFDQL